MTQKCQRAAPHSLPLPLGVRVPLRPQVKALSKDGRPAFDPRFGHPAAYAYSSNAATKGMLDGTEAERRERRRRERVSRPLETLLGLDPGAALDVDLAEDSFAKEVIFVVPVILVVLGPWPKDTVSGRWSKTEHSAHLFERNLACT